jgi:hypothetical protein
MPPSCIHACCPTALVAHAPHLGSAVASHHAHPSAATSRTVAVNLQPAPTSVASPVGTRCFRLHCHNYCVTQTTSWPCVWVGKPTWIASRQSRTGLTLTTSSATTPWLGCEAPQWVGAQVLWLAAIQCDSGSLLSLMLSCSASIVSNPSMGECRWNCGISELSEKH